jgi:ankyrin repeat protein
MNLIKLLLKKKVDFGAIDRLSRSSLHWFAEKGYIRIVMFLNINVTPIHHQDNDGETPLHEAVSWDRQTIVKLFLVHCANGDMNITSLLKCHGAKL